MKRLIFIFIPLALLIASCKGQKITKEKVPSLVFNSLKAKYPVATDIDWKKQGTIYEAELDINDSTEVSLRIDEAGNLLMQKSDILLTELPQVINAAVQRQYAAYTIDDVEKIEQDGGIYYQVEMKAKGKKEVNIVFSADGKEVKNPAYWD